jgi:hypothetical protein
MCKTGGSGYINGEEPTELLGRNLFLFYEEGPPNAKRKRP